jgi:hypothetical protein
VSDTEVQASDCRWGVEGVALRRVFCHHLSYDMYQRDDDRVMFLTFAPAT